MELHDTTLPFPTAESAPVASATDEASAASSKGASPDTPPAWVGRAAQLAHEAIDSLAAKAGAAAGTVQGSKASLGETTNEWVDAARGAIREKPFAAIGLAALAGVLFAAARQGRR